MSDFPDNPEPLLPQILPSAPIQLHASLASQPLYFFEVQLLL